MSTGSYYRRVRHLVPAAFSPEIQARVPQRLCRLAICACCCRATIFPCSTCGRGRTASSGYHSLTVTEPPYVEVRRLGREKAGCPCRGPVCHLHTTRRFGRR